MEDKVIKLSNGKEIVLTKDKCIDSALWLQKMIRNDGRLISEGDIDFAESLYGQDLDLYIEYKNNKSKFITISQYRLIPERFKNKIIAISILSLNTNLLKLFIEDNRLELTTDEISKSINCYEKLNGLVKMDINN